MIYLNFSLENPWSDRFENLWGCSYDTPFKHKFIELELTKCSTIISLQFNWTSQRDHAGLVAETGLLGYCFRFNFYDSRHWNYETNKWEAEE
jgi:hypothetical protein